MKGICRFCFYKHHTRKIMDKRFNFLKERIGDLKEVIVYGAGYYGIIVIYLLQKNGINVVCMDNDLQKKGKILLGSIVCNQPYFEKDLPVIISVKNKDVSEKIYSQCRKLGYTQILSLDFDEIDYELSCMPDKEYLDVMYATIFDGKVINWDNPKTFNEKLQWLKLYDRNPEYTKLVDKYEFKNHVANVLGEEYVIPLLGVWNSVEEIKWDDLPNQFVLKCTHDSGSVIICRDKDSFDIEQASVKLKRALEYDYYLAGREWPYKNVKHRIIAEQYMQVEEQRELRDYKFYCFDGTPRFLYISEGLENYETAKISYIDIADGNWKFAPFRRTDFDEFEKLPQIPNNYEEMFRLAEILSKDCAFVRVDLYDINGKIYTSEMTFTPGAGFTKYEPEEWNYRLGNMINLPRKREE